MTESEIEEVAQSPVDCSGPSETIGKEQSGTNDNSGSEQAEPESTSKAIVNDDKQELLSVSDNELETVLAGILKTSDDEITLNEIYPLVDAHFSWSEGSAKSTSSVKQRVKDIAKRLVAHSVKRKREEKQLSSTHESTEGTDNTEGKRRKIDSQPSSGKKDAQQKSTRKSSTRDSKQSNKKTEDKGEKVKVELRKMVTSLGFGPKIYAGLSKDNPADYANELEERIKKKCEEIGICTGRLPQASEIREYTAKKRNDIELDGLDTSNIVSSTRPRRKAAEAANAAIKLETAAMVAKGYVEEDESDDESGQSDESESESSKAPQDGGERGKKKRKDESEDNESEDEEKKSDKKRKGDEKKKGTEEKGGEEDEDDEDEEDSDFEDSDDDDDDGSGQEKSSDSSDSDESKDSDDDSDGDAKKADSKKSGVKRKKAETAKSSSKAKKKKADSSDESS